MTNKEVTELDTPKDERELEELFGEVEQGKLDKLFRRAKWGSIIRTTVISMITAVLLWIGGTIVAREYTYKLETPVQIAVNSLEAITNEYVGKITRYHGFLNGRNSYTTYKLIEGKVVYTGQNEYYYGLFQNEWGNWIGSESPLILGQSWSVEDLSLQRYNELGQREMVFFYPFINYPTYKNDLALLEQIGPEKNMEMALSFDRAYSIPELKGLLPDGVNATWYWADDLNNEEKEKHKTKTHVDENGKTEVLDIPDVRSERTAYGIKLLGRDGELLDNPEEQFIWAVKNGRDWNTRYKGEFDRIYNNIAGEDKELTVEDFKIQGVIVTGNSESLEALKGLPVIKASSLGVVTEKF